MTTPHYLARVVQRDGVARFLTRGQLTDWSRNATLYSHPSAARRAIARFLNARNQPTNDFITDVIDANDPERGAL